MGKTLLEMAQRGVGCNRLPLFVPVGPGAREGLVATQDLTCISDFVLIESQALPTPLVVARYLLMGDWPCEFMAWAQKTDRVSTGSNPCLSTRPYSKQRVQALASLLHTPDVVEAIADDMEVYVDIGISLSTPARLLKAIPCERGLRGVNSTLQAVRSISLPSADHVLVLLGGVDVVSVDLGRQSTTVPVATVLRRLVEQYPGFRNRVEPFPTFHCNSISSAGAETTVEDLTAMFYNDVQQLLLYIRQWRNIETTRPDPFAVEVLCTQLLRVPDFDRPRVVPVQYSPWRRRSVRVASGRMTQDGFTRALQRGIQLTQFERRGPLRMIPWAEHRALVLEAQLAPPESRTTAPSQLILVHVEEDESLVLGPLCPPMRQKTLPLCETMGIFANKVQVESIEENMR